MSRTTRFSNGKTGSFATLLGHLEMAITYRPTTRSSAADRMSFANAGMCGWAAVDLAGGRKFIAIMQCRLFAEDSFTLLCGFSTYDEVR